MGLLHFDKVYRYLNDKEFSLGLIRSLTSKIMLLSSLVHKETILSSEAKVADLMLENIDIFNRLKNNEIASMLNLSAETFSRIITKFKREGIIRIERSHIEVVELKNSSWKLVVEDQLGIKGVVTGLVVGTNFKEGLRRIRRFNIGPFFQANLGTLKDWKEGS